MHRYVAELRRALRPERGHMVSFEGGLFHGGEPIVLTLTLTLTLSLTRTLTRTLTLLLTPTLTLTRRAHRARHALRHRRLPLC